MVELCGAPLRDVDVPVFIRGAHAVETEITHNSDQIRANRIMAYIAETLPCVLEQMQDLKVEMMNMYLTEWCRLDEDLACTPKRRQSKKALSKTTGGTQIKLILADDTDRDEQQTFNIGSSATLKTLFNDYADKRRVSLRSLRFSYHGETLFLSNAGRKTPEELHMHDQDIISVHDTSASQEASCSCSPNTSQQASSTHTRQRNEPPRKKRKTNKKKNKRTGIHEKKQQSESRQNKPAKTLDEYKAEHSIILSKLHEEVQHQLKEIRMRLNALDLERQPPKQKKKNNNKKKNKKNMNQQVLPKPVNVGKAGKPYYYVQVGDVKNLYRTCKPCQKSSCEHVPTLDLHGLKREEALDKLDDTLEAWVDDAMHGSYPFVLTGKIICGCGNQIISETVDRWIHEHAQVANAPKNAIR
mmetsp:Transcript_46707/g.98132  ORF Transcript_46707/g.98132 Transcript_46707/m.98132 type:complete len:413 (+) Transcript_46707:659-1897(+)